MTVKMIKKVLDIVLYLVTASLIIVIISYILDKQVEIKVATRIDIIQLILCVAALACVLSVRLEIILNDRLNEIEKKLKAIESTTSKS